MMTPEEEIKLRKIENRRASKRRYDQSEKAKALKCSDRYKNKAKEWKEKNQDKIKQYTKKSYENMMSDPEKKKKVLERNKKWRQANPQKQRAAQAPCDLRRRLKNMSRKYEVKPEEKEAIYQFYLNCPPGYEVDHIIPLARGGTHSIDNLQYLLPEENDQKGDNWIGIECEDGSFDPNALLEVKYIEEEVFRTPKWKKEEEKRKRLLEACEEVLKMA